MSESQLRLLEKFIEWKIGTLLSQSLSDSERAAFNAKGAERAFQALLKSMLESKKEK